MRATLEQLKAMSDKELESIWSRSKYPFDFATCGHCLTMHALGWCKSMVVMRVSDELANPNRIREHLEEMYSLRLFYDSHYPTTEELPSLPEAVATQTVESSVVEKLV